MMFSLQQPVNTIKNLTKHSESSKCIWPKYREKQKLLTQENSNEQRDYCAATTAIWTATNLDPWRNKLSK